MLITVEGEWLEGKKVRLTETMSEKKSTYLFFISVLKEKGINTQYIRKS